MEKETLEEAAREYTEKLYYKVNSIDEFNGEPLGVHNAFIEGAKYQAERMYSEEEVKFIIKIFNSYWFENNSEHEDNLKDWELSKKLFEQFKKK
jgi:hypothetical protein